MTTLDELITRLELLEPATRLDQLMTINWSDYNKFRLANDHFRPAWTS